ncbi:transposase family protein [Paraburkholderia sp. Ac-20340]|uniref:DDE-type integrase/transposase/recombinase n=1 Tax=Paraburkholderia sp. Ac-20340 TaxID=2703888 RepID=UPI00197E329F|nr:DDE-type integrase/transposase/recombinase [Paraburkholderia sp. Ac-20340]MBN3858693.1 transposase family protein [Paraburkholderia sp. Ac-20340]
MLVKSTCPTEVSVCDVLAERNGERIYIVLKTGRGHRWTHLIDIEHKAASAAHRRAQPFKLKTDELLLRLSDNCEPELALKKLEKLPNNVTARRESLPYVLSRRSEKYKNCVLDPKQSKGWKTIEGLLTFDLPRGADGKPPQALNIGDEFEELLHRETRHKRIKRYSQISGISEASVYRTFRRYCQQGMTPAAASDDYDRCGGRGKVRNWKRRPGKCASRRKLSASAKNQEIRRLLSLAADYYLSFAYSKGKRSQKSLDVALDWLRKTFLTDRAVYNESGELVDLTLDRTIVLTRRQLQYHVQQESTYEERRIHKVGLRQYMLHERPLTGRLRTSRGPGERFHIDATVIDIYLVGQVLRTRVIGRAVLYLVVDDYSGLYVGFYLTFDPACWNGAMMALAHAVSPKVPFCKSLGIDITEEQWPASRLCEVLYADQGEVSSVHKAHPLINFYHVEVSNAPAYRPDLRSVMERRFGMLPRIWNSLLPGIVEKSSFERGVEHPAYHAALDIKEMRRVITYAILSANKRVIRGYPTPPEMVDRELAPTPLNLWRYGTEVNGCGRHVDVAEFRAKMMPRLTVPIDKEGIVHNAMRYSCPTLSLVERQSMARAKTAETSVDIQFDSTDVGSIELLGLGEPIRCPLSNRESEKFAGVSYQEYLLYKDLDATNCGMADEDGEADRAKTSHNISKIGRDAVTKTAAALEAEGIKRPDISGMDDSRETERAIERGPDEPVAKKTRKTKGGGLKKLMKKFSGFVLTESSEEQPIKYDEEGDICEESVTTGREAEEGKANLTSRDLREERARKLLEFLDE